MYAYIGVQVYTGMYRCKRVYTCIYTVYAYIGAQVCTGVLVCIYRCIGMYRCIQVCTGVYRCTGVLLQVEYLLSLSQQQQLQAQHLSHGHALPVPLTPHPAGLQPPTLPPVGGSAGLLALSSALGGHPQLPIKDEKKHHDNDHQRGEKPRSFGP